MRDDSIREHRISGSEIAAVAGLSPWQTPLDVYLRKIGEQSDELTGHHIERGTHLGPALVRWYSQRTGCAVTHAGRHEATVVHPTHHHLCATPDGRVCSGPSRQAAVMAALEVKAPGWRTGAQWGEPGTDQIPEYYVPQVTLEAAVLGVDRTDVAALIDGDLRIYTVPYDDDLFYALSEIAGRFLTDHVYARVPPPVDGSDSARDWLARQHPRATRDLLDATDDAAALAAEYAAIAAQKKTLDTRQAIVRNSLVKIIGDHAGIRGIATLSGSGEVRKIDWEAIARQLGATDADIEAATTVAMRARALRVHGV